MFICVMSFEHIFFPSVHVNTNTHGFFFNFVQWLSFVTMVSCANSSYTYMYIIREEKKSSLIYSRESTSGNQVIFLFFWRGVN